MIDTCSACGHEHDCPAPECYEIQKEDVRKRSLRFGGKNWNLTDSIGPVQVADIGKRLYVVTSDDGSYRFLQMESAGQRDARKAREERGRS